MPTRKKSTAATEKEKAMSFEDALEQIEAIVQSMEGDQLPLEDLVSQYEKSSQLLKHCDSVLASARKRIELITLNHRENDETNLSEDSKTPKQASLTTDEDPEEDNDTSLF